MYLKEIKAFGFKSFADKISILFCPNINGIVGPNGSGKSNVVDAVLFVLGEQSSKALRGDGSINDVIFSGSKSRKPLNSASVTLVFDNSDHVLPIDYEEVSIKRTVYKTGENEYFINGERCRLKDITDLLIDTSASKESFNIIGQGKISEIISSKPVERRVVFEEAAGVLKYKKRKEEAIRKLEKTNNNLIRVNDIINELEVNLEPLKRQSEDANLYLKTKEELSDLEISLITADIVKLNFNYNEAKSRIELINDEIVNMNTNNSSSDVKILENKNKLRGLEDNLNKKQNELLEVTSKLEKITSEIKLLQEREKYNDNKDLIKNNIIILKEDKLKIETNINSIKNDIELNKKELDSINDKINNLLNNFNALKDRINKLNNEINKNNREENDLKYKIEYLENKIDNNSTLPNSVRSILNNNRFDKVHNIIGNLIKIKDDYNLAITTTLGISSSYIVVDDEFEASRCVKYLKENNLGRATFYPLNIIEKRQIPNNIIDSIKNIDGFVDIASNLVSYDNIYENIILNQLGNVIVCDNIDKANIIANKINHKYKIVTLDGNVVNVGGSITGGSSNNKNNILSSKYELDNYNNKYRLLLDKIKKDNLKLKEYQDEENKLNDEIFNLRNNYNLLNERVKNKEDTKNKEDIKLDSIKNELNGLDKIIEGKISKEEERLYNLITDTTNYKNDLVASINMLKLDKNLLEEEVNNLEEENKKSNLYVNKKEKELKDLEILTNRIEVKLDSLLVSLNEDYNMTFENAKDSYKLEIEVDLAREKVNELKNKIKEIGVVNLGSIEEYERVNTRYSFLTKQKEDLNKAEEILLEIINEMDEVMIEKFKDTFDKVRVEFKKVFKELFHGGDADLKLTDSSNLLETGVEIVALPPGKSLKSINALSGGEQTFTAISLLFAILNIKNIPFCIFDEVEAALDEVNVDSFGKYLDIYKNKTQFILITHKKKTMEYANLLYGITMQESGVSRLVSVKLEDIEEK